MTLTGAAPQPGARKPIILAEQLRPTADCGSLAQTPAAFALQFDIKRFIEAV
jgi:hypothetical protein